MANDSIQKTENNENKDDNIHISEAPHIIRAEKPVPTFNQFKVSKYRLNINTAKSLQKSTKQFASRRKSSPTQEPVSCLGYTFMLIHLFSDERMVLQMFGDIHAGLGFTYIPPGGT